jgi:hypothetical protein
LAQVFELCEQFQLALIFIATSTDPPITISDAFTIFETGFIDFLDGESNQCNDQECRTALALMECFEERVVPFITIPTQPMMFLSTDNVKKQSDTTKLSKDSVSTSDKIEQKSIDQQKPQKLQVQKTVGNIQLEQLQKLEQLKTQLSEKLK